MPKEETLKPTSIALGAAFAVALSTSGAAQAGNPFTMTELQGGFLVAEEGHKCGGGASKDGEKGDVAKCGSGCGAHQESATPKAKPDGKGGEVAKCGNAGGAAGE
jgi:hypothetical protein